MSGCPKHTCQSRQAETEASKSTSRRPGQRRSERPCGTGPLLQGLGQGFPCLRRRRRAQKGGSAACNAAATRPPPEGGGHASDGPRLSPAAAQPLGPQARLPVASQDCPAARGLGPRGARIAQPVPPQDAARLVVRCGRPPPTASSELRPVRGALDPRPRGLGVVIARRALRAARACEGAWVCPAGSGQAPREKDDERMERRFITSIRGERG